MYFSGKIELRCIYCTGSFFHTIQHFLMSCLQAILHMKSMKILEVVLRENKYEGTILFQCSHRYSSSICAFKYHNHSKKLQSKYLQLMTFTIHITAMKTGRNKGSLSMDGYVLNVVCGNVVCRS